MYVSHDLTNRQSLTRYLAPAGDLQDLKTANNYPIPSATIMFIKPSHLTSLTTSILDNAKKNASLLYSFAWRHKVAGMQEGFITKQSLWDRLVFDGARVSVLGNGAGTVRAVIVSGGMNDCPGLSESD